VFAGLRTLTSTVDCLYEWNMVCLFGTLTNDSINGAKNFNLGQSHREGNRNVVLGDALLDTTLGGNGEAPGLLT
jgi:hypothetical protein